MELSWNRGTHSHHPFIAGVFHEKNQPFLGIPHDLENPHMENHHEKTHFLSMKHGDKSGCQQERWGNWKGDETMKHGKLRSNTFLSVSAAKFYCCTFKLLWDLVFRTPPRGVFYRKETGVFPPYSNEQRLVNTSWFLRFMGVHRFFGDSSMRDAGSFAIWKFH